MKSESELPPEPNKGDRLNNWVAISVALLAAFMAVTKVKDDNIVQAMLQAKSDAVDTWAEYQATKIKQHVTEGTRDQAAALRTGTQPDTGIQHYEAEISRYQAEEEDLKTKARAFEAQYDALNFRDDQFDLSDALLSVSLAMMAVTALTRKQWLLWLSLGFAAFGAIMGLAGLIGWKIHPNWVIKLLS